MTFMFNDYSFTNSRRSQLCNPISTRVVFRANASARSNPFIRSVQTTVARRTSANFRVPQGTLFCKLGLGMCIKDGVCLFTFRACIMRCRPLYQDKYFYCCRLTICVHRNASVNSFSGSNNASNELTIAGCSDAHCTLDLYGSRCTT